MATSSNPRSRMEEQLQERAARDPQFRQQLMDDPKAAIQQEVGVQIPDGVQISVLEETPARVYLILPSKVSSGQKLSEEDLEKVAGGSYTDDITCLFGQGC